MDGDCMQLRPTSVFTRFCFYIFLCSRVWHPGFSRASRLPVAGIRRSRTSGLDFRRRTRNCAVLPGHTVFSGAHPVNTEICFHGFLLIRLSVFQLLQACPTPERREAGGPLDCRESGAQPANSAQGRSVLQPSRQQIHRPLKVDACFCGTVFLCIFIYGCSSLRNRDLPASGPSRDPSL